MLQEIYYFKHKIQIVLRYGIGNKIQNKRRQPIHHETLKYFKCIHVHTYCCVCINGILVLSKLSGWLGGTISPVTGWNTGSVDRGQAISLFLDISRSSLVDFWIALWWTSWMLHQKENNTHVFPTHICYNDSSCKNNLKMHAFQFDQ